MKYKFLSHTADIKFRARGRTVNEAFENAVLAVSDYLARGEKVKAEKKKVINISGHDLESLLYAFLEEIIYLLDTKNFVVGKARVAIRGNNLKAELFGDATKNYELGDIKAVTYSEMYVKRIKKGFELQVVLDV